MRTASTILRHRHHATLLAAAVVAPRQERRDPQRFGLGLIAGANLDYVSWNFASVAPKKPRLTLSRPLRLSPRDTLAYIWMSIAGDAKNHLGSWEQAVEWFRRKPLRCPLPAPAITVAESPRRPPFVSFVPAR